MLWVLYLRNFLQLPFSLPLLQQELRRRVPWSSIRRGWSWNRSLPESRILEPESPPCWHCNPVCSCCSKARQQSLLWWAALRPSKAAQTILFCQELECFFLSFFFFMSCWESAVLWADYMVSPVSINDFCLAQGTWQLQSWQMPESCLINTGACNC